MFQFYTKYRFGPPLAPRSNLTSTFSSQRPSIQKRLSRVQVNYNIWTVATRRQFSQFFSKWTRKELLDELSKLEFSSADISKNLGKKYNLSLDKYQPEKLARNKLNWRRCGRDDSFHATYSALEYRLQNKNDINRLEHPLSALHAPPGGGKSFFLDELCALRESDISVLCKDYPLAQEFLRKCIPITITYSDQTYFKGCDYDATAESSIATRILASFYKTHPDKIHEEYPSLNISNALDCIYEATNNRPILLAVDETINLNGLLTRSLTALGSSLSRYRDKLHVVLSSLDVAAFKESETASGRPIHWIPLPLPEWKSLLELFTATAGVEDVNSLPLSVKLAISDCNGHFRSLEALSNV